MKPSVKTKKSTGKLLYLGSASGVSGMLIRSFHGHWYFRTTKRVGTKRIIKDYEIHHDDLGVTIESDGMAGFYKYGNRLILDHSPQVLGYKVNTKTKVVAR
jgi:hypothetical protein